MSRALALIVLAAALGALPARAALPVAPSVVAGPGSYQAPLYSTPVVVVTPSSAPELLNRDLALHDLASLSFGSDDAPWCRVDPSQPPGPDNPRRFAVGRCPLFFADDAQTLNGSRPILGVDALTPGSTYAFACLIFPGMRGILAVVADPS